MHKYLTAMFLLFLFSCNQHPTQKDRNTTRGFYYWKSVFKLSDAEKITMDSLKVSTLYLKCFDVDWNENSNQPNPVAQVRIIDTSYLQKINVVPVVFITNECILKLDSSQSNVLAEKIYKLVKQITTNCNLENINELQIDCDWTASTREKYFSILKRIKNLAAPLSISATIRLHQVKYTSRVGIPPVDRGLLMCYNMGNLKDPATNNSIIEASELKKYIGNLSNYSLPLDVAFPLFDWKVLFRNNTYTGLIQNLNDSSLIDTFIKNDNKRYVFLRDTTILGYSFKKDDVLRSENSDYNSIIATAKLVNERLSQSNLRVSLYHLDSITLSKYSFHEMENIFNSIH